MSNKSDGFKIGFWLFYFIASLFLGGWSVNYLLMMIYGKTIPFIWATVIGLIVGGISFPVAIVAAILHAFGVV